MADQPPSIPPAANRRRPTFPRARAQSPDRAGQPGGGAAGTPTGPGQQPPSFAPSHSRATSRVSAQSAPARPSPGSAPQAAGSRASAPGTARAAAQPPSYAPKYQRAGAEPGSPPPAYPPKRPPLKGRDEAAYEPSGSPAGVAAPARQWTPPARPARPASPGAKPRRRRRWGLRALVPLVIVAALIIWPLYLINAANSKINHVEALSAMPAGSGTTWLIAGSDKRSDGSDGGVNQPWVQGARTDTLMLVRRAGGQAAVVSLPRDTAVQIPGHGLNKLNAAYALGGPKLLVATVERLTGTKVDHYIEIGMGGVTQIVDSVGGVNLCSDLKVNDPESELVWKPGCRDVDGKTALAFARMRKQDPRGDIGRQERQRQVIQKLGDRVASPWTLLSPSAQSSVSQAVAGALSTDPDTGIVSLAWAGWNYRNAGKAGLSGIPPIASENYRKGGHGAMVLLDKRRAQAFWAAFADGTLTAQAYQQK